MKPARKFSHLGMLVIILLMIMGAGLPPYQTALQLGMAVPMATAVRTELISLPLTLRGTASAALGADDPAYGVVATGDQYLFTNSRHDFTAAVGPQGFGVHHAAGGWQLRLAGWGRGESRQAVAAGISAGRMNRVEVDGGNLVEWWINGPLGLEQGWSVAQLPQSAGEGALTLFLAQSGSLRARAGVDEQTLAIVDDAGRDVLRYAGLVAVDAKGRQLPARFVTAGDEVRVVVDDAQAVYPIRIDPWVQAATLTAADGAASDLLGMSLAISADGSTVVAGAPPKTVTSSHQGAVYVFVKPAGGWANGVSTARLIASDAQANNYFGGAVAISADGATIVAGSSEKTVGSNANQGQAYVFVKPTSGWATTSTATARLTASDGAAGDALGRSVAVSADGTTVVAGAPSKKVGSNKNQGQVYVFVKPISGWAATATEMARLKASDGAAYDSLGRSVAVSGDGATIVAGAPGKNGDQGAVDVFVKPVSGWAATGTQTAMLKNSDYKTSGSDFLGTSVAISNDGTTVAAGAPNKYVGTPSIPFQGEVYVFVKPASGWVNGIEKAQLKDSTGASYDLLGTSVAVSGDGGIVAAGAPSEDVLGKPGAIFVYVRPASGWANATETSRLTATGIASANLLGTSVAVGGSIIVGGAPYSLIASKTNQGALYVFTQVTKKFFLPYIKK